MTVPRTLTRMSTLLWPELTPMNAQYTFLLSTALNGGVAATISLVLDAGVAVVSIRGAFLEKIAPPERVTKFTAPFSAVLAGLAFLFVKILAYINHQPATYWGRMALVFIVLSVIVFVLYFFCYQAYTLDYAGQTLVIGKSYTEQARNRLTKDPNITKRNLVAAFPGEGVEGVWTPETIRTTKLILTIVYCLFIWTLSFTLYLGIEVLNNTWAGQTPPSPGVVLASVPPALKDVHFDLDKFVLSEDARAALADDAGALKPIFTTPQQPKPGQSQQTPPALIVVGFCDDQGSFQYNMTLGYRRADAAKAVLVENGLPAEQIQTVSHGNTDRICSENTETCRSKNRRVHLTLVK